MLKLRSLIHVRPLLRQSPGATRALVPRAGMFWEPSPKSEYGDKTKIKKPTKETIREGLGDISSEFIKWGREWKKNLRGENFNAVTSLQHGDYEYVYKLNSQADIDNWTLTQDKDFGEGSSHGDFVLGPNKTGIFRGTLDTTVPKDGIIKKAGYCNIRSQKNRKSFHREQPFDWTLYTHLVMRVRGDGRPLHLILGMDKYFDVNWNDTYQYPLFTRGGPYWQVAKIPFSKFFLATKGRIQDKQEAILLDKVSWVGITVADSVPGPFHLEVDYIAAIYDARHEEDFAYEMYQVSPSALY